MPLNYPLGTLAEHLRCRSDSVVFDVSHLGSVHVADSNAMEKLQTSFTNDLTKIGPGRAQYTHLLDETGSVVDDIIVWWLEDGGFMVIPNASNTERVITAVGGRDVTAQRALLAVQGPSSQDKLTRALGPQCWVPRFQVRAVVLDSVPCLVAGTGYTGEAGVEIHTPREGAKRIWNRIVDADIPPAGLGARDTLRLEAGLPLYGHELGPGISPLQADLEWVVAWNKSHFVGREALIAEKSRGVQRLLFGIATEGRRPPRAEFEVFSEGLRVGHVTSGNFSPVLEHGVALALLDPCCSIGDEVVLRMGSTELPGRIVTRPFVDLGR